jgi:hypothetical protein
VLLKKFEEEEEENLNEESATELAKDYGVGIE